MLYINRNTKRGTETVGDSPCLTTNVAGPSRFIALKFQYTVAIMNC